MKKSTKLALNYILHAKNNDTFSESTILTFFESDSISELSNLFLKFLTKYPMGVKIEDVEIDKALVYIQNLKSRYSGLSNTEILILLKHTRFKVCGITYFGLGDEFSIED